MKKIQKEVAYTLLIGALASSLAIADSASVTTSSVTSTSVSTDSQAKSSRDMKWTELKGKVTHVDLQNKIIQIKETGSDTLLEVPVDADVAVYKHDHHKYDIGDLKEGDKVLIRHSNS